MWPYRIVDVQAAIHIPILRKNPFDTLFTFKLDITKKIIYQEPEYHIDITDVLVQLRYLPFLEIGIELDF